MTIVGYGIEINGLSKQYGAVPVLKDIDIDIEGGKFIALVGKSGCGKSTLLRIISALTDYNKGNVVINGKMVKDIDSEVRFLFQDARLLPWKTVLENVILGAPDRDEDKALAALEAVELVEKKDFWPADLSGGQRQRVALARALVGTPKVLLLDEPLSALDALTKLNMQKLIEKLWQEWGFTVILVTHDVSEAVNLADRVLLIENGSIALDLDIQLARPRTNKLDNSYYENIILEHIMKPKQISAADKIYYI